MYDSKVKMNTKTELDVINSAYLQTKLALEDTKNSDFRNDEAMSKAKGDMLKKQGIELAINEHIGKETEHPVLSTLEYRPKSSPFILQIIDEYSGELIVESYHNGLASALFDLRENSPLENVRCILWIYTPGAGYRDLFDSVHAESIGHDHLHINDEGYDAWISSDFIDDPDNPLNASASHRVYGLNLKAHVHREETEKDGHYVSLVLVDSEGMTCKQLFEVVIMLTPTDEEDLMI